MKKNSKYIVLTAAFLALFSCTQEEFLPQNVGKDVPITLSTVEVEGTLTTRATTTALTEGSVGMFVKDHTDPNNPDYNARNCRFECVNRKWEFVADKSSSPRPLYNYMPEYDGSRQFAWTYSPYIADIDNPAPFELQAMQTAESIAAQEKYLFAWEPVFVGRNGMVSIRMKHALSKVRVFIKEILPGDVTPTSIESVSLGNMLDELAWDFSSEPYIGFKVPDDATYTGTTNMYKVSDTEYEAVVLPSEKDGKFEIALNTSDGRRFTAQVDYPTHNNKTGFQSNYIYMIELVVGVEKISIASVTVEDWKDGGTIDAGQATEPEATYSIDGSTMTVTVDEYTGSFSEAVNAAIKQGCETMIVNGTLTARQQTVLANTLLGYEGTLVLDMAEDAVTNDALKSAADVFNGCVIKTDDSGTTYEVYTAKGLWAWSETVQTNFSLNLTLMADITLPTDGITVEDGVPSGSNWPMIGEQIADRMYIGTVDGNGKTISGLRINSEKYAGFVTCMKGGTIKKLTLDDAIMYSSSSIGGIAGITFGGSTITGCTVKGSIKGAAKSVGGLVGSLNNSTVSNCLNEASVTVGGSYHYYLGGIAGDTRGSAVLGCTNNGSVTALDSDILEAYIGGIVGYAQPSEISNNTNNGEVKGCTLTATDAKIAVGGIAGYFIGYNYSVSINNQTYAQYYVMHENINTGSVTGGSATNAYVGGLVGLEESLVSSDLDTYGSLVFHCNTNSGTTTDKDGNLVTYLVGWSARGKEDPDTDEPEYVSLTIDDLTHCDGKCTEQQ